MHFAVNEELVAKLQSEIALEEDMVDNEDLSLNIKEYLESSEFKVILTPLHIFCRTKG